MKALVIGGSGLVGAALLRTVPPGWTTTGTSFAQDLPHLIKLDAGDPEAVKRLLEQGFDWVLMPAANPNVDGCERDPLATRRINVEAVAGVVEACQQVGAGLVYFSSDYVFDGKAGPYTEDDLPKPICEYGRQKLEAEQIVDRYPHNLVIRATGVFGIEHLQKNFVYRVIQTLGRGEVLTVPIDQMGNPTLSDDLARMVWRLCQGSHSGLFHVAGRDCMARIDFAALVARVFRLDTGLIRGVSTQELGQLALRPLQAGILSTKAEKQTQLTMLKAETALRVFQHGLKAHG